jgi:hypothetical protein
MKKALSLTALSALLKKSNTLDPKVHFIKKKIKTQGQRKRYENNNYLKKAFSAWNVDPTSHRAVQSLKKSLKNYPHITRMEHPYQYGMPLENKQVYTAKRAETLRRLSQAKMHRASQKLKGNLHPSKRSKLTARLSRMKEKSHKL